MLFADLLSLHLVTFLMFFSLVSIYSLTHAILSLCLMMIARVVIKTLQIKFCYQPSQSKIYCLNLSSMVT